MKKFSDYNIKEPTNCNFKNFVSKIYGNLCTHGALRSSLCLCVPDRIGIWNCWFLRRGGKPDNLEKNLSEQAENQQHTQLKKKKTNSTRVWR